MTATVSILPKRPRADVPESRRAVIRAFVAARHALGLTQESIALKLGKDMTTVGRWESGKTAMPAEHLWTVLRWARAAGVPCPLCEGEERKAA